MTSQGSTWLEYICFVRAMSPLIIFILHVILTSFKMFLTSGTKESARGGTAGPRGRTVDEEERARSPDRAAETGKGKSP